MSVKKQTSLAGLPAELFAVTHIANSTTSARLGCGAGVMSQFGQSSPSLSFRFYGLSCCMNTAYSVPKQSPGPWGCTTDVMKLPCEFPGRK